MSVSRTSFASPPVQGTIDVTFNGVTKSGNTWIFLSFILNIVSLKLLIWHILIKTMIKWLFFFIYQK